MRHYFLLIYALVSTLALTAGEPENPNLASLIKQQMSEEELITVKTKINSATASPEALKQAVYSKQYIITRLLLNNGAVPDYETILLCAEHSRTNQQQAEWWLLYQWAHGQNKQSQRNFYFYIRWYTFLKHLLFNERYRVV